MTDKITALYCRLSQQIDIYYRFDVAVSTAVADSMKYDKKRKAA